MYFLVKIHRVEQQRPVLCPERRKRLLVPEHAARYSRFFLLFHSRDKHGVSLVRPLRRNVIRLVEINRVYFFQTDKLFYGYRLVLGSFQLFKIFVGKNDEFSLFVFVCFDNILLLYGSAVALVAGFEISYLRHGLFVQQSEIHSV